ncbi:MAG: cytochrome b N-terminal domain-containing protein [Candidatus Marsarchaeota archaeon]|nr:cytochrome b N-terminal domain-containing protein [Candidatus Marsarchaeota archaeon]
MVNKAAAENNSIKKDIKSIIRFIYIKNVPSYANSFFFLIGVYLLEIFGIIGITGMIMLVFGPYWWDLTPLGTFVRSIHMWAAEAFVTLMFLHLFVNFSTSAFKKKKLMWMIGSMMLFLALFEFAFGVGFGGSLFAQANQQAGADLWNGMGLGYWINPMNSGAVMGWHVAIIPMLLILLMGTHYLIARKKGLNTPYRKDVPYTMVAADHGAMYKTMLYVLIVIMVFAILFRAPYVPPLTISQAAQSQPGAIALTFLAEFNYSSQTATYMDTIDPYNFNTRSVYVTIPYDKYLNLTHSVNAEESFLSENSTQQNLTMSQAASYFTNNGTISNGMNSTNPLIRLASSLTYMAQSGVYEPVLQSEVASGANTTYATRFLDDAGALWGTADKYGLGTAQYGMLEVGPSPWYLQYWLLPYNLMENATAGIPWWSDLENGLIATFGFALLLFLPYIPGLRDIPDKLGMYKIFWKTKK